MKKIKVLVIVFAIFLTLTACSIIENTSTYSEITTEPIILAGAYVTHIPAEIVSGVRIVSGGNEHSALAHWHHGGQMTDDGWLSASGAPKSPEDIAEQLQAFSFEDDFHIILEGPLLGGPRYYFYKLIENEWSKVLAVYDRDGVESVFVTHGSGMGEWEEVFYESFLSLLEPGEYILEIGLWWGDANASSAFQNFFRLIK
jgi:hypothetical protein